MDCKEWSEKKEKLAKEEIKRMQGKMEEWKAFKDDNLEKCIKAMQNNIDSKNHESYCKDDCEFCETNTLKNDAGQLISGGCVGPKNKKYIKNYPENSCKKYGSNDITVTRAMTKNFTCDYNNNTGEIRFVAFSKWGFTITEDLKPENLVLQNGDKNIDAEVCTCSNDGCNKVDDDDNEEDDNNHASDPNLLNYLLILALLISIRFQNKMC